MNENNHNEQKPESTDDEKVLEDEKTKEEKDELELVSKMEEESGTNKTRRLEETDDEATVETYEE